MTITHTNSGRPLTARERAIVDGTAEGVDEVTRRRYVALYTGDPAPVHRSKAAEVCPHRGEKAGYGTCAEGCGKGVRVPVFACALHGTCSVALRTTEGHARCKGCPDNPATVRSLPVVPPPPDAPREYPPVTTRHLLYHVYPRRGGAWRRAVLALRERIDQFDGRRVVAVAHDGTTDDPAHVEDALAGCGCEFVRVPNDPTLREVATFEALFGRVADRTGPGDITLYAHAKGATRPEGSTARRWADALAELYLDHPDLVAAALSRHPVAGAFLKEGMGWRADESRSAWHYSGSWFWVRNASLFARDWRRIDRFWSGIEAYPSLHFPVAEAGCVFHRGRVPTLDLYRHAYWDKTVQPELETFRAAHPKTAGSARRRALLPASAFAAVFGPLAGRRVGYVPTPGNAGDHLIEAATFQLMSHFGVRWVIGPDPTADVLLVPGGGSMGCEEYGLCRDVRRRALAAGPPVWVLPQSWKGPDPDAGYARLFARDGVSLGLAGDGAAIAPDLSLGLEAGPFPEPPEGRGVWLRDDVEALFADRPSLGDPVGAVRHFENPGWAYLDLAARHAEIVTDRLHFAIAGLIAGRAVTLLPNAYHKNRACWEAWLAGLGCRWADTPEGLP